MLPPSLSELRRTSRRASKILSFLPHILVLLFFFALAVFAWTEPSQAPPGGNMLAPINIGSSNQVKSGGLWLGSLGVDGGATIGGNVGIGTPNPGEKLQINGENASLRFWDASTNQIATIGIIEGTSGWSRFSVRDDSGNERLSVITTGGANQGNVGIGTATPGSRLTVNGQIESTSGGIKFPDGTTQNTAAASAAPQSTGLYGLCAISGYNIMQNCYMSCTSYSPATCNRVGAPSCPAGYGSCGCPAGYTLVRTGYGLTYWNGSDYSSDGYRESCYKN